ncbi:MAG: hypothetical protein K2X27_00075 [Candidatus Obscuribacterales bacterium]|nr:hypothetical protein [Candidatus Obscuribacterales bacterium]
MTRLRQGALVTKWTTALVAASLFITPVAWAQTNTPEAEKTQPAESSESASKGTLTFTPPSASDTQAAVDAASAGLEAIAAGKPEGKLAEISGAEAAASDGAALAANTGGSAAKRLDPAYIQTPTDAGKGTIRKSFKLFAKEELIHNLSFRDTPIKEVVAELARRGNLNIILDKSVFGKITGDLHDVTLNEAMDSVLASAGLQSRVLDSNTVVIGSTAALTELGLSRTHYKVFRLSYISPFDMANILIMSVFNKGILPDFNGTLKTRSTTANTEAPSNSSEEREEGQSAGIGEGGSQKKKDTRLQNTNTVTSKEENDTGSDYSFSTRLDTQRQMLGVTRLNVQEGTGFNNAAQDPGTQQIRAYQETNTTFSVLQNGGGAIVIPDRQNKQVVVVGTPDDIAVAEECVRCLDRRPRQVHIQVSVVELNTSGIRQLGASLNLQGQGASGALLGGTGAPLVNALPGMGSAGSTVARTSSGTVNTNTGVSLLPPGPNPLLGTFTSTQVATNPAGSTVAPQGSAYSGLLGGFFPTALLPAIAGVTSVAQSASNFNFLTLGKEAGGRTNIATVPMGLNLSVNLLLQQNKAKILANPSVVVTDNTEALVTLASEVIHKVTSTVSLGVTNVNVELTKAGIFLDVMPQIADDGFIRMRIRPQVSAPIGPPQTFANQQVIVTLLNIREIMAQEIRVKDGQTLVLGGLFTEQEAAQISKVPYLAETPLFGALFRNTLKGRQRTELMLMITPKIVEEQPNMPPLAEGAPPANL